MPIATFAVDGLRSDRDANSVKQALQEISDVKSVKVALDTNGISRITIDAKHEMGSDEIQRALVSLSGDFEVV